MADLYKIEEHGNGRFTAYERDDGRWEIDRPGRGETFSLSRNKKTFVITERDDGITTRDIYRETRKNGIYKFRETDVIDRDPGSREETYKVDRLTGGKLNVYEWDDGRWQLERPDRNERFNLSRDGNTFKRIESQKRGVEVEIYKDFNNDGIFEYVRTRFEGSGNPRNIQLKSIDSHSRDLIPSIDQFL